MAKGLLYARSYAVNDKVSVVIPTVGQILEDEDSYYGVVTSIIATPSDFMVQLDDAGIDFSTLNSYELFLMLFPTIQSMDTSLIFKDLDLKNFKLAINEQNGMPILKDEINDVTIDRGIHGQICAALRKINHLESKNKKPANEEAKKYMLERARAKQRRAMHRKKVESQIEDLIVAMVNTEQYKYNYETTLDLTIHQFNTSVHQIVKKVNYDNLMIGCYAGTVNIKEINQDSLNWLSTK